MSSRGARQERPIGSGGEILTVQWQGRCGNIVPLKYLLHPFVIFFGDGILGIAQGSLLVLHPGGAGGPYETLGIELGLAGC